jgi:ATP-dependent protease HslVU (ClpYQ) peptidase subunit
MSTVVVARKGGTLAIASDSLVTFGETRLPHGYEANAKMFEVAGSFVGAVGTTAHMPVLQQALRALPPEQLNLHSRAAIFETFLKLHPTLKDRFFMNTK